MHSVRELWPRSDERQSDESLIYRSLQWYQSRSCFGRRGYTKPTPSHQAVMSPRADGVLAVPPFSRRTTPPWGTKRLCLAFRSAAVKGAWIPMLPYRIRGNMRWLLRPAAYVSCRLSCRPQSERVARVLQTRIKVKVTLVSLLPVSPFSRDKAPAWIPHYGQPRVGETVNSPSRTADEEKKKFCLNGNAECASISSVHPGTRIYVGASIVTHCLGHPTFPGPDGDHECRTSPWH